MRRITLFFAMLCLAPMVWAQQRAAEHMLTGMRITNVAIEHDGEMLYVGMRMELDKTHIKGRHARIYTPILYHGSKAIELTSVGIFGREHYFIDERQKLRVEQIPEEWRLRRKDLPAVVTYFAAVPYEQWMNGATLRVEAVLYGCGDNFVALGEVIIGQYHEWVFNPVYVDVKPTKTSNNSIVRAYIDFPLMDASIDPAFANNATLLGDIAKFFDRCAGNVSCDMTAIHITGYASPDGVYDENAKLAKERAEALCNYLVTTFGVKDDIITLSSVAEDWDGVVQWVEASSLKNKSAILDIINGTMSPDEKEYAISTHYPKEYQTMLHECYPPLRRATYMVDYKSCGESLDAAAKSINAANAAMRRGDMASANNYLKSAGTTPLADYARALYTIHMGNLKEGVTLLNKVKSSVPEAAQLLKELSW